MSRNLGIDLLKILSCLGVIILHVTGKYVFNDNVEKSNIMLIMYYIGSTAVPIFFMANSYFILNKEFISFKYILNKIFKVLRVVAIWNIFLFAIYLIVKQELKNPITLIIQSLMQNSVLFYQFWFFGTLIILLLLAPVLNFLLKKYTKIYFLILLGLFLISISLDLFNWLNQQYPIQSNIMQTLRLWTFLFYYMLGGAIGYSVKNYNFIKKISIKVNLIFLLIVSILAIAFEVYISNILLSEEVYAEFFYDNIFVIIWAIIFFVYCLNNNFNDRIEKFISTNSKYIMGVFIVHIAIIKILTSISKLSENIFINIICIPLVYLISMLIVWLLSRIPIIQKSVEL